MNSVIVDLQGYKIFKDSIQTFILKEIAVINIKTGLCQYKIFGPPFPWSELNSKSKRNVLWLTKNHHNLNWHFGDTPYKKLVDTVNSMLSCIDKIYIKGSEKVCWLENIIESAHINITNIETLDCPALEDLSNHDLDYCTFHIKHCAVRNVHALKKWFNERFNRYKSLQKYLNEGLLSSMWNEEIATLPIEFVMVFAGCEIENLWDRFPRSWQDDEEFQKYRSCFKHVNVSEDQVEGPIPIRKNCAQCYF